MDSVGFFSPLRTCFFKFLFISLFTDSFRFEWQARGSPHIHGFLWISPDISRPPSDLSTFASRKALAEYWGAHIEAMNPFSHHIQDLPQDSEILCKSYCSENQTFLSLAQIINKIQTHQCDSHYCLRKNRRTRETSCRFYFPRAIRNSPEFTRDMNPEVFSFAAKRNDENLNQYNRSISLTWLANTDISVCGDSNAVINYIAKYCSKAETQSASFNDIIKAVLPALNLTHPRLSLVQRTMNRLVAERDISGQELQHYIQGLPLHQSSRDIISIDCRPFNIQQGHFFSLGGEILAGKTLVQRYISRQNAEHISFLEWIQFWDFKLHRLRPRARPRVPLYRPVYKGDPAHAEYSDFCRVKVRQKIFLFHYFLFFLISRNLCFLHFIKPLCLIFV